MRITAYVPDAVRDQVLDLLMALGVRHDVDDAEPTEVAYEDIPYRNDHHTSAQMVIDLAESRGIELSVMQAHRVLDMQDDYTFDGVSDEPGLEDYIDRVVANDH